MIPSGFTLWVIFSTGLAFAVVQHAFSTRESFFPAAVYLSTSKFAVAALVQFCIMQLVLVGKLIKWVFLGQLSQREVEVSGDRRPTHEVRPSASVRHQLSPIPRSPPPPPPPFPAYPSTSLAVTPLLSDNSESTNPCGTRSSRRF